jgi:hypothetical protein
MIGIQQAASTEDVPKIAVRDSSFAMKWRQLLTKELADTTYSATAHSHASTLVIQEGGVTTDATVGTINFDSSDFNLTESPEDTVAVALAYGIGAGTPAEGNHLHDSTYVNVTGDTMTGTLNIDSDGSNLFRVRSAGGTVYIAGTGPGSTPALQLGNAADIIMFSDNFSTQVLRVDGATGDFVIAGSVEIDGNLNHDGSLVGFFGVAPAARPTTYTVTNLSTDRAYDANATTTAELADVLGTLIADLRTMGLVT